MHLLAGKVFLHISRNLEQGGSKLMNSVNILARTRTCAKQETAPADLL